MKQLLSDKYNIAWFKLADCISRGEKERALGMYRLLSHSIDDDAYVAQLEGDIFLAFSDEKGAIERYRKSADLYRKSNRLFKAAAIYEHIVLLSPCHSYYTILITLYKSLNIQIKVFGALKTQFSLYLAENKLDKATKCLEDMEPCSTPVATAKVREKMVLVLLAQKHKPHKVLMPHIKTIVDAFINANDSAALQAFLSKLEATDELYYKKACNYMDEDKPEG